MTPTCLQVWEPSVLRTVTTGSEHWDGTDTKPRTEKGSALQASGMPWREVPPCPSTVWTGHLTSSHCTRRQGGPETEAALGTEGRWAQVLGRLKVEELAQVPRKPATCRHSLLCAQTTRVGKPRPRTSGRKTQRIQGRQRMRFLLLVASTHHSWKITRETVSPVYKILQFINTVAV